MKFVIKNSCYNICLTLRQLISSIVLISFCWIYFLFCSDKLNSSHIKIVSMKRICLLTTILISTIFTTSVHAQFTNIGRAFYVSLYDNWANQDFAIISNHKATVSFHFFADPSEDFSVEVMPGEVEIVTIPAAVANATFARGHENGDIDNKSLRISADSNIAVTHLIAAGGLDEGSLLYPIHQPFIADQLDTFYCVNGMVEDAPVVTTSAMVVSHYDCVSIEVLPTKPIGGYPAGEPFIVELNEGETFTIGSDSTQQNYTGTRIRVVSSKNQTPISVIIIQDVSYASYPWLFSALTGPCCVDYLYEQILPTQSFDTMFHLVPPFLAMQGLPTVGDIPGIIKIFSIKDDNRIFFDGIHVATLQTGEVFDTLFKEPLVITSDSLITAHEFLPSNNIVTPNNYSDPDQLLLNPIKMGLKESYFKTFDMYNGPTFFRIYHVLTLITRTAGMNVNLDGGNINSLFTPFPSRPEYSYAQLLVDSVVQHHLTSEQECVSYFSAAPPWGGGSTYTVADVARDFHINLAALDSAQLSHTTYNKFCDSTELKGRLGAAAYLWNNGLGSSSITATSSGTFWVTSFFVCDSVTDTFHLTKLITPEPYLTDTILCRGEVITIDYTNPVFDEYQWNTPIAGAQISINSPGIYWIKASSGYENCPDIVDSIAVVRPPDPELEMPNHVVVCDTMEAINLGMFLADLSYQWNTGDTTCCITVDSSGIYEVVVSNACGDTIMRSSEVQFLGCDNCLLVPTAFSPNGDGLNDKFKVVTNCGFSSFQMAIYNRWGQAVFTGFEPNQGWDGTQNGENADVGVYFYYIKATPLLMDEKVIEKKGDLTLLR